MDTAVVAAIAITALSGFLFLAEWPNLTLEHARRQAYLYNTMRWLLVVGLAWALIPVALSDQDAYRVVTVVGLGGLLMALMLVPLPWLVQLAGRDPIWELRGVRVEVTQATNRIRQNPDGGPPDQVRPLVDRIRRCRTAGTAELCDLLEAEVQDVAARAESWNEAGRRTIRIDQLCRDLWGDQMPPPDYSSDEATFRWRLYRAFGQLLDLGTANPTRVARLELVYLLRSMNGFRRTDTTAFISDVRRSALHWLQGAADKPWVDHLDFAALGPNAMDELKRIWGRDSALWGAQLDDEDQLALQQDRARRAQKR